MAENTSIVLGEHVDNFISARIQDGRYGLASKVMRQGLRLRKEHEQKIKVLRQALIDGENSASSTPLDMQQIIKDARQEAGIDV